MSDCDKVETGKAELLLSTIQKSMQIHDLDFSLELSALRSFAVQKADQCKHFIQNSEIDTAISLFEQYQLGPLSFTKTEIQNRLQDSAFWLKRIRRQTLYLISQVERALGYVSKRRAVYCGDVSMNKHHQNKLLSRSYMDKTFLVNDEGVSIPLSEIAAHNISNPEIRRHELMVRIRGFEEVAQHCNHAAVFVTITTPSRMHATLASGLPNKNYDGTTTREAHAHLNHIWQLCRAKFDRADIRPYGFRVVEPHHDGTPHWHLLLFMPGKSVNSFKTVIENYALHDSPDEPGAKEYRVKFIDIDPAKGSASGYVAKYIAKNIDGYGIDTDNSGHRADTAADRINVWSKSSSIRQFQQIGGPSVTVWRELRRLRDLNMPLKDLSEIHSAADSSNWAAFCLAMNAIELPRKEHICRPFYRVKTTEVADYETGEIVKSSTNKYQEARKPTLAGFWYHVDPFITRFKKWTLSAAPPKVHGGGPLQGGAHCVLSAATLGLV